MWIKLAQDYFNFTKDICIGIVYLSPAQSSIHVQNEVDIHRSLELQVAHIIRSGASCFLVGDFNSRTAQQMDYNTADTNDGYIPLPEEYVVDDCGTLKCENAAICEKVAKCEKYSTLNVKIDAICEKITLNVKK